MEPTHTFKFKTATHDMIGDLNLTGIPTITMTSAMMDMTTHQIEAFNSLVSSVEAAKKVFGEIERISFVKITP